MLLQLENTFCNKVRNIITNWKDVRSSFNQLFNKICFVNKYEKITLGKIELLFHLILLGNQFQTLSKYWQKCKASLSSALLILPVGTKMRYRY